MSPGLDTNYQDQGPRDSLPVVLIHGFPFDHTMWEPQVQALKDKYRVITYDVRGLGKTPARGTASMEVLVDDLIALLDQLGIPSAAICGLSMGGYIALRLIEKQPKRIKALILADTRSEADTDQARQGRVTAMQGIKDNGVAPFSTEFIKKAFAPGTIARKAPCVAHILKVIQSNDPEGIQFATQAMMSRTDTTPVLAKIKVPTLVLVGELDSLTSPVACQALAKAIPRARYAQILNAAHVSNLESPEVFNKQLLDFLASLPR